jgi:hypothetical protein
VQAEAQDDVLGLKLSIALIALLGRSLGGR